jgi:hypothetical protein
MKKVSISHSTAAEEQSSDQKCDYCVKITRPLLSVLKKFKRLCYFLWLHFSVSRNEEFPYIIMMHMSLCLSALEQSEGIFRTMPRIA